MVPRELVSNVFSFLHRPIRVGFVGHRPNRLPDESVERVRAALESACDSIEAAGKEAATRTISFILSCGLAEGADRIAAEVALARGWTLEAPLPFSIERYEQDFATPDSVAAFQTLLKQAAKVRPLPQNDERPELAYLAAGLLAIKTADLALVVWDGAPGAGPGGTPDIAARALDIGMPVIWVGVAERQRSKLILPDAGKARKGERAIYLRGALAARFEKTERPAALRAGPG